MVKIVLKPGKDEAVRRRHPWIFSGAIGRIEGEPYDGDLVEVFAPHGPRLGIGHYHKGSIAVRLLGRGTESDPNELVFWQDRLSEALQVRRTALLADRQDTDCFRWVHGEGDGLSGLIVDVYAETAVVQCHSIGMHRQRVQIAEALRAVRPELKAVYDKSVESLPPQYAKSVENSWLWTAGPEPATTAVVQENGVRFWVDWESGQKTGFFLDQRDNRELVKKYAPGRLVLNAFCYTGGFSCYALQAGARAVHSVDISARAMELTQENVDLNRPFAGAHEGFTDDVLKFLRQTDTLYDLAVVDPPAFAKSLDKRHNAVLGYKRLNELAIKKVAPGGLLFTFSCSQVVDRELFYHTIVAAALEAGRSVRVLHHLTQGADHPVNLFHPEGSYLKGLVLYVS